MVLYIWVGVWLISSLMEEQKFPYPKYFVTWAPVFVLEILGWPAVMGWWHWKGKKS